jgi:hypothetical protein
VKADEEQEMARMNINSDEDSIPRGKTEASKHVSSGDKERALHVLAHCEPWITQSRLGRSSN